MRKKWTKKEQEISTLVVISDTHCGCRGAIIGEQGAQLDDGGRYHPSAFQKKIYAYWREFWDEFIPEATRGDKFAVVHNGDAIDGVHHGSTSQISHNLEDQSEIAYDLLAPIVELAEGRYYHIRGTEAHVGQSGVEEERLAKRLHAIPDENGKYARWDLRKRVGKGLVHLLHHVGATGSVAYEATAVHKELVETILQAALWKQAVPDMIVRSHRHRFIKTEIPSANGRSVAIVTPCWQGKTPFVWKIPGGRLSTPQFGGIVIKWHDRDKVLFTREYVKTIGGSKET